MYYILIAIIMIFDFRLSLKPEGCRAKSVQLYSYIICALLILLAAFRSDLVGTDTPAYREDYTHMNQYHSMSDIIERYSLSYIGYYGLSKLFHMVGMSVQVWFGFVEAVYLFALMKLINQFSKDKIFSLLVFITIGLFTFSLAGLKQTLGSALVILAFVCFINKKYILAILLACATYFTHPAALIGLGTLPLYYLRNSKWFLHFVIFMCIGIYIFNTTLMSSMVNILGNDHFERYLVNDQSYTYVTFIFYTVITLIAFIAFKNYNKSDPEFAKLFLGLSILGCGIQLMAGISPSLFRLALMYTPFMTILLPNAAYYSKSKVVRYVLMGCVIFFFLYTNRNTPYSFI